MKEITRQTIRRVVVEYVYSTVSKYIGRLERERTVGIGIQYWYERDGTVGTGWDEKDGRDGGLEGFRVLEGGAVWSRGMYTSTLHRLSRCYTNIYTAVTGIGLMWPPGW